MRLDKAAKQKLSSIAFFISLGSLALFMNLSIRGVELNFALFWLLMFAMYVLLLYQVHSFGDDASFSKLILLEIVMVAMFFVATPFMFLINLLPGSDDAYNTLASSQLIQEKGNFLALPGILEKWPLLQILVIQTSQVLGLPLYSIAMIFPILLVGVAMTAMFMVARTAYGERVALLACAVFSSYYMLSVNNARLRPEILAYSLFILAAFISLLMLTRLRVAYSLLAILFMLSVTMTHFTTNVMLVVFFTASFIAGIVGVLFKKRKLERGTSYIFPFIALVVMFGYTIMFGYTVYIGTPLIDSLVRTMKELEPLVNPLASPFVPAEAKAEILGQIISIKGMVVLWGERFYLGVFAALIAFETFRQRNCDSRKFDLLLGTWIAATLLVYFSLSVDSLRTLSPSRILLFSYPFVLIFAAHVMLRFRRKVLCSAFLFGFVILNVIRLPFVQLTPALQPQLSQLVSDGSNEIALLTWHKTGNAPILVDSSILSPARFLLPKIESYADKSLFDDDMRRLKTLSRLYFKPKDPHYSGIGPGTGYPRLEDETVQRISRTTWLDKVYANGEWEIYDIRN